MPIHTVLGPIAPGELGATSMHEHCLVDARAYLEPPRETMPKDPRVTIENLGFVRANLVSLADNLVMDDPAIAIRELRDVRALGGSAIVDMTTIGLGRRIEELPEISRRSGLHVIAGCGFYVDRSLPEWVRNADVDELAEMLVRELRDGVGETGIRPGIIGEIGTTFPTTETELKALRAAAVASVETGAAVNVHLAGNGAYALDVLAVLTSEGMAPAHVIFSHLDTWLDREYHRAVAESGAVLEYDTFGQELEVFGHYKDPRDSERLEYVRFIVEQGWEGQLVLGCDVWVKATQRTFGGAGYEHLLKRIVPAMTRDYDIPAEAIDRMLIENPRRLLDRP